MAITPLVSIGMPLYNGEKYLRQAFDSLLAQDFTDFEIIVSDNSSTDSTAEIYQEYAARDDRIRFYVNQSNIGPRANFIRTLDLSIGRYFIWAAHDDLWEPDMLSSLMRYAIKNPNLVFLCGDYGLINYVTGQRRHQSSPGLKIGNSIYENCMNLLVLPTPSLIYYLFRRDALIRTKFVRQTPYDFCDLVLLIEMALMGDMLTLPKTLYWAGVTQVAREGISFGREIKSLRFGYYRYYIETFKLLLSTSKLSFFQKVKLLYIFSNNTIRLIRRHESKNLRRVLMFFFTLPINFIGFFLHSLLRVFKKSGT